MSKKLISYLRDKNGKKYGVVVFTSPVNVGYSICNKKDTFSKKKAVEIATVRADRVAKHVTVGEKHLVLKILDYDGNDIRYMSELMPRMKAVEEKMNEMYEKAKEIFN